MPEKKQDPFGSITIAPDTEKTEAGQVDFQVPIEQPPSRIKKQKQAVRGPGGKGQRPVKVPERKKVEPGRPGMSFSLIILPALVLLAFLAYTLIGFLGAPYFLKSMVPAMAEKSINRSLVFGSVRFNPFTLRLTIRNAIIGPDLAHPDDPVDPLFSAGLIEADIAWSSLVHKQLICEQLAIDNLFLHLVRNEEKKYNVTDLLPVKEGRAFPVVDPPFAYFLQNITVSNSRIILDDLPAHKTHTIEQIQLALPLLFHYPDNTNTARSTFFVAGGTYVNPQFSALINGSPVELTGKTKIEGGTFTAQLQMHLDHVDLPAYLAYLPVQPQFRIDKGTGDILMDITFLSGPSDKLSLEIETSGRLTDVSLLDKNNDINLIPEASVRATLYPLLSRYAVKEIMLTDPHLRLTRLPDGNWSFPALGPARAAEPGNEKTPVDFIVDRWKIANGRLSFVDRQVTGGFTEEMSEINFTLSDFNRGNNQPAPFSLEGVTSDKNKITITGEIAPSSMLITGLVTGGQVNMQKFSGYLTGREITITQGKIDRFTSRFSVHNDKNGALEFHDGDLALSDIALAGKGGQLLVSPKARLIFATLAPAAARLEKVALTADRAEIFLQWTKENHCNWALLPAQTKDVTEKSWQISFASVELPDAVVHLEDHSLPTPVTLVADKVQIQATDLSTSPDHKGNLSLTTDNLGGGQLSLAGTVGLSPFSAHFSCALKNYNLAALPSLVTDWLDLGNISGGLEAHGDIALPRFTFAGAVAVHNFSAGREHGPELIRFATAEADKLDFSLRPLSINSAELLCNRAYLRWNIPAKGPMNLETFFSRNSPGLSDFTNSGQITLATIKLTDATLDFTDQRVTPAYSTQLRLDGTVDNLINAPGKMARVALNCATSHDATGTIAADIAFFDQSFAADLNANMQNMRVEDFSAYLSPVLGYTLHDGRFQFSTSYHQKNDNVTAANTLSVSGLQLGEQRGVPNSQLPLTVALLTDQQGSIALNLPIQGSTADTSYTFTGALGRSLRNIALKTAVSPFSQLQAAFPEMDQSHDYLLFLPGSADLSAENKKFLSHFAQVISQRPHLTLMIKGFADTSRDQEILLAEKKEFARQRELRQEQKKSMQITQKYGGEEIPAANNQQQPTAPIQSADVSIGKSELLQLARQRQNAVADFLVSALKVDAKRVIRDSVGDLVPANAAGRPGARVDLKLGAVISNK
jgi:uncharacterized protein involved in outer membrane biogenesis